MKQDVYDGFTCVDCGVNTFETKEYYMVHNHLWEAAGMEIRGGMLCINDLERRLGRKLVLEDFTGAPINGLFFHNVGMKRFV